uniref:Gamma-secretase subunit APH-1 n=1 Tax=Neolamprologus brichardi TaxID=32507 RepID=A0A3Q4FXS9_NEOBR
MTAAVFFGCTFIAFGPAIALFLFTIAREPLRVIFLIAGCYCHVILNKSQPLDSVSLLANRSFRLLADVLSLASILWYYGLTLCWFFYLAIGHHIPIYTAS